MGLSAFEGRTGTNNTFVDPPKGSSANELADAQPSKLDGSSVAALAHCLGHAEGRRPRAATRPMRP